MRGNETDKLVGCLNEMFRARGLSPLDEDERVGVEDAFDDAINARVEAFWNEQHRIRD
jgi:hypothetical protein